jgi:transposase
MNVPPALAARTRALGSSRSQKNDPNDARSVVVTALRQRSLQTVHCDDHAKVLKLTAKRHAMSRVCGINHMPCSFALLELHPGGLRGEYLLKRANTILDRIEITDHAKPLRVASARELIADITSSKQRGSALRERTTKKQSAR